MLILLLTTGSIDWSRAILDGASARDPRGESPTGPNPVDRGKPGSKIHVLSERGALPISLAVSASNTHDSRALSPLVNAIPAIRSRRGPRRRRPGKLHADKAASESASHARASNPATPRTTPATGQQTLP
ncbi:transposase [Amycolatopsis rhizosphaerae]|uniref:Transposase n=1 Tax=Amycolatopsis rhizosphaerae TaxID=2053003 RepID=A0A558BNR9_9PSEU|nr:transposase [Amycolatopsis rhizosphaerae]